MRRNLQKIICQKSIQALRKVEESRQSRKNLKIVIEELRLKIANISNKDGGKVKPYVEQVGSHLWRQDNNWKYTNSIVCQQWKLRIWIYQVNFYEH